MVWFGALASGVKKFGEEAKAKDVSIAAEAKANAEAFIEKNEEYEDTITMNKNKLRAEAESLQALVGSNVGKIRTVMNAYGNVDVVKKLEQDFLSYQAKNIQERKEGTFKNLKEYINGKLKSNGIVSDEAAEVAEDEAAIAGETFDIKKAQKKAKAQGVSLDTYLQSQAIKMTDKPSFNLDARAAKLVEESKMGLLGKTLTLDEAKTMIMDQSKQGISPVGPEAEDLGETGFTFERDYGPDMKTRLALAKYSKEMKNIDNVDFGKSLMLERDLIKKLPTGTFIYDQKSQTYTKNDKTDAALLDYINKIIGNSQKEKEFENEFGEEGLRLLQSVKTRILTQQGTTKAKDKKTITLKDVISSKRKAGKSDDEIAKEMVKNGKAKTLEEAKQIIQNEMMPKNIATQ